MRQETLQAHSDRLLAMDRYAFIDVAFIQHVAGEGGQDRLETVYLQQCLPSKDKLLSIAQAWPPLDQYIRGGGGSRIILYIIRGWGGGGGAHQE